MHERSSRIKIASALAIAAILLASCTKSPTKDQQIAIDAFAAAAEQCVYDVRDRGLPYTKAPNCARLAREHGRLIVDLRFREAESTLETRHKLCSAMGDAWVAVAVSNARHAEKVERIW